VGETEARPSGPGKVPWRALAPLALMGILLALTVSTAAATDVVFSDGFESGNLSQWTASSGMVVQQQVTYEGSWAARATATGSPGYAYKNLSTPLSELYYDGRFQVISQGTANVSLARFRTAANGSLFSIFRLGNGKLSYFNSLTGIATSGPLITTGSWHELEVHALINGNSSLVEVWLDGTKVVIKNAEALGTTGVGRIYIGDPSTGLTFDTAFDNQTVSVSAGGDTSPPTVPTGLTATVINANRVDLSWNASTDDVGVAGYTVYRNGTVLTSVGSTAFSDLSVTANTTYSYTVDAFDAAGNHSAQSSSVSVTTPPVIFSDGFESGDLSRWTRSGGTTVQQQVRYSGTWAARATSTGSSGAYAYKTLSSTVSELYYDGRFNVISQGSSTNASLTRFTASSGGGILSILRRSDGRLASYNQVTGVTTVGPVVSPGAWHELEVHVLINGNSGQIEVWLDGTRIGALSRTDNLGTTPVGRLYIGDPSTGRTFDFAFDDEVLTAAEASPPTTPTGLAATPIGATRLNLTWNASTDDHGVAGYTLYRGGNAIATLGPNTLGYADSGLSSNTTYSYAVDAFDAEGNRSARSSSVSGTTGSPSSSDPVIAAAGDIACDPLDSQFNGGNGTSDACRQLATSNILFASDLAAVLPLGDNQYENGTASKFTQSYDASWGRVFSLTKPVPGNHEYQTQGAAGYYAYFGSRAGDPTKGYYSYDIGAWHIIALNSECAYIGGCGSGSAEETWLRNDLASHTNACTLAYWHRPRSSSGFNGGDSAFAAWWTDLYNAHAEVVLNGHDHDYERFAPQDPSRNPDPNGIREFVVGTGGEDHLPFESPAPNSEVFRSDTFGVLKLTLHSSSYDWQFVPEAGRTFTDSGTTTCH
jgi:chitodextrinase